MSVEKLEEEQIALVDKAHAYKMGVFFQGALLGALAQVPSVALLIHAYMDHMPREHKAMMLKASMMCQADMPSEDELRPE